MPGDKKIKILLTTGIFPPDIGGPATYAHTLYQKLPQRGWAVKVITYSDRNRVLDPGIFTVSRRHNLFCRYFKYFWRVWRLASWADVIYTQDAVNAGLPTWLAAKLRRRKYVLKVVGDYAWEQGCQRFGVNDLLDGFQGKKYGWPVELFRRIERLVARRAEIVITPSQYLKKIVKQWGVKENKIRVIYNAVKIVDVAAGKEELRPALGLSGYILLSVGRLVPWKGFGALINLMPELLRINSDFKLVIIGGGPKLDDYKLQITNHKLEKQILLLGAVEQKKVRQYMKAADIFVLNTGYEGLPHTVIEAMQAGLPVVATAVGGNPEVVAGGETGLLVEYNNKEQIKAAILRLRQDKELARRLADRAQKAVAQKFNQEKMVAATAKLLAAAKFAPLK